MGRHARTSHSCLHQCGLQRGLYRSPSSRSLELRLDPVDIAPARLLSFLCLNFCRNLLTCGNCMAKSAYPVEQPQRPVSQRWTLLTALPKAILSAILFKKLCFNTDLIRYVATGILCKAPRGAPYLPMSLRRSATCLAHMYEILVCGSFVRALPRSWVASTSCRR